MESRASCRTSSGFEVHGVGGRTALGGNALLISRLLERGSSVAAVYDRRAFAYGTIKPAVIDRRYSGTGDSTLVPLSTVRPTSSYILGEPAPEARRQI